MVERKTENLQVRSSNLLLGSLNKLMAFSAVELTSIIEERLANYYSDVNIDEIGRVLSIGDGIARIYGLGGIQAGEMCLFPHSNIKEWH